MSLYKHLFVTGQTIESIPLSTLAKSEEKKKVHKKASKDAGSEKALARVERVLDELPLLFTSTSADNKAKPTYSSGHAFVRAARDQNGLIMATGMKIGQASEYVNMQHDDYQDWLANRERKSKKVGTEIRA